MKQVSSSKARTSLLYLAKGFTDRRALPVTLLLSLQGAYYAFYSFAPGLYQRKLTSVFSYSQNHRQGALLSWIGHQDLQSYLASTAILGSIGYRHAVMFGAPAFIKFIALGALGGVLISEAAYLLRGKKEGWMLKTSGLAGPGALLLYHSFFSMNAIHRMGPLVGLAFLAYGNYYADGNVTGAAVGTLLAAALI